MLKFENIKDDRAGGLMAYKVLALDIDGTLTNSQKQITDRTKRAVAAAAGKGVKIVIASGRPVQGIRAFARELELEKNDGYILSFNGGRLISCRTGQIIHDVKLPLEYLPEIYALSKKYNVNLMSYEGDDLITEEPDDEFLVIEARINGLGIKKVDNFVEHINFPINKCLMLGEGDYLAEVEKKVHAALSDRMDVYRSEPYFLEILPKGVDKAKALAGFLERLGCTRDELMACGDGFNDLTMIKYAGLGVAMANAREEVKACAHYVTASNDEDGVALAIENFILK